MSDHRHVHRVEKIDGVVFSGASCECGWSGPLTTKHSYDADKRLYRNHVEEALGEMAFYDAPVRCLNCAYEGSARIHVGESVWAADCPRCGVDQRLRPDNEAIHDENERMRRWRL